jgi:hypothetical protein
VRVHRHDAAVDFRHLTQAVIGALVDGFDIDEIADLHHVLGLGGRRTDVRFFELLACPQYLAERHARLSAVG